MGYVTGRPLHADPSQPFRQQTPVAAFTGSKVKPRIGLTPILRAGLGMTDALVRKANCKWCFLLIRNAA